MNFESVYDQVKQQASQIAPLGGTLKLLLDGNSIMINGTGKVNLISTEDNEADTVIILSLDTFLKLKRGAMNPIVAMMYGKVKTKGNMSLVMKLQSLLYCN
jgi:putative sterol carrier protein